MRLYIITVLVCWDRAQVSRVTLGCGQSFEMLELSLEGSLEMAGHSMVTLGDICTVIVEIS